MRQASNIRRTLVGFALAVGLTLIAFLSVAYPPGSRRVVLGVIAATAILQIMVHLHFFLGIGLRRSRADRVYPLVFAGVLMFIMIGGTLWVMGNMSYRMGH